MNSEYKYSLHFNLFVLLSFLVRSEKNTSFFFGNSLILTFYTARLRPQD